MGKLLVVYYAGHASFPSCRIGYAYKVCKQERICATDAVFHVHLVPSRFSANTMKISELYLNFCPLAVRSSCSRWVFFFHFLAIAIHAVFLASLRGRAVICSSLCVHFIKDKAAASNVAVGAEGVLWFPAALSADEYISRYFEYLDARRLAALIIRSMLTAETALSEHWMAYAAWVRHWKR